MAQALELSRPIYERKMAIDYERPAPAAAQRHFDALGLRGAFWCLA